MKPDAWRLSAYDLPAGRRWSARAATFAYAVSGRAHVGRLVVGTGEGAFAHPGDAVVADGEVWLFEAAPGAAAPTPCEPASLVLSLLVEPPATALLMRADRVESESGARTPAHRHRGPGLRRLVDGLLRAEIGDRIDRVGPGGAWFETGRETVIGTNVSAGRNVFIRVMLLPADLLGGLSSFLPSTPDDAARPRSARIHLFGEWPVP